MSMHVTRGTPPASPSDHRSTLLASLAAAIRSRGGATLLALAGTDHPVLYVRRRGRVFPVVVVQGITSGWWFIWGRTASVPASRVEAAADELAGPRPSPLGFPPPKRNLVTDRRRALKGVA